METNKFIIYTDGACIHNGKINAKCSIGIHFSENNSIQLKDISRKLNVPKATNNIAELTAILEALKSVNENKIYCHIVIYSDSEYCINILKNWYPNWFKKGIVEKKKNHKLITELYNLYKQMNVSLIHIRAHTGLNDEHSLGNEKADQLATFALKFENKPNDILKYFKQ